MELGRRGNSSPSVPVVLSVIEPKTAMRRSTMTWCRCLALGFALAIVAPLPGQELVSKGLGQVLIEGRIEGQEVEYRVENKGARIITAWAVELSRWFAGKRTGAAAIIHDGWPQLASFVGTNRSPDGRNHGVILPGQFIEGTLNIGRGPGGALPDRLELSVTALIDEDLSHSGSAEIIDGLFAKRQAEWIERARWGRILRSSRSIDELREWGPRIAAAPPADETLPATQVQIQKSI